MPPSLLTEGTTERFPWRSVTAALVLHAAAIALLASGRIPAAPPVTAEPEQEVHLLAPDEEATTADATEPGSATAGAVAAPRATGRLEPRPAPTRILEAPPASSGSLVFTTPASSAIGLGGANPFLARGTLPDVPRESSGTSTRMGERPLDAKTTAEAEAAVNRALGERLADRSKKGLGPEGPVLHALEDATNGSAAPVRGSATFVAVVDGNGFVTDVKVVDASGDRASWAGAAQRALAALKGKKLPGVFHQGDKPSAELRIQVASDEVLPSGAAPDHPVEFGTKGSFDVADLGGKVRRVVHARLTGIREM